MPLICTALPLPTFLAPAPVNTAVSLTLMSSPAIKPEVLRLMAALTVPS